MSRLSFRHAAASGLAAIALTTANAATADAAASAGLKSQARSILTAHGLSAAQFRCFDAIITRESSWNPRARNASSGAYGLAQALPASKMASAGADWRTNPKTQIKWGVTYMKSRYGSPCNAWAFWQKNHWY